MRKLILFAVVALIAIVWTVSVQSASTAQAENCVCVPGPQCDNCPNACATTGKCDASSAKCDMMKTRTQATAAKATTTTTLKPAATPTAGKATTMTAATSSDCGKQCPTTGCGMAKTN